MYEKHYDRFSGGWSSDWVSLGGVFTSPPAIVSWGPNRLDVFAIGSDGAMWRKAWGGNNPTGWDVEDWYSLGGKFSTPPAVAARMPRRLDVVALGTDNQLYHISWQENWSNWEPLGGPFRGTPTIVSWGKDRLDIFVLGTDYVVWHKAWTGNAWSDWESPGGDMKWESEPVAVVSDLNRIELVALNQTDDQMYHKTLVASEWGEWGGIFNGVLTAVSLESKGLDIFGIGTDNAMWHHTWSDGQWATTYTWDQLGGVFALTV
ncbi:fucose-specific lectin [Mytilinidion resinicola]|uniref:Fucose-specific lectin n=1 Tax=Mytilinidion resinicola TaxID=574789 RepID=A0A6A6Z0Y7_9PEZI|nr:fucose-specific lectin [Mytilinidion resinicola]KAF2813887.1 fucose-specific lectin [Mytilinidion resinicola]